jgi:hypothetical protein
MMFPTVLRLASAAGLLAAGGFFGAATAVADSDPPPAPLHNVHYTIWAEQPYHVDVYYHDADPPNWGDYSHNPYQFTPKVSADVGPTMQWNLDVGLADPNEWAMVVATSGRGPNTPNVHCALAVDGAVVATNQGPKGALCSIRNW